MIELTQNIPEKSAERTSKNGQNAKKKVPPSEASCLPLGIRPCNEFRIDFKSGMPKPDVKTTASLEWPQRLDEKSFGAHSYMFPEASPLVLQSSVFAILPVGNAFAPA